MESALSAHTLFTYKHYAEGVEKLSSKLHKKENTDIPLNQMFIKLHENILKYYRLNSYWLQPWPQDDFGISYKHFW